MSLLIECALLLGVYENWDWLKAMCECEDPQETVSMCGQVETPERVAKHPLPSAVFLSVLLNTQCLNGALPASGENSGEVLRLGVESCLQVEISLLPGLGGS